MFGLLGFLGDVLLGIVDSNNKRDISICKDNNQTRVDLAKIVVGGVALVGTLALQWKCTKTQSTPSLPKHFDNNNLFDESEENLK